MKRTYRTIWAAALLMLAACTNEEVLTTTDNPDRGNEGQRVTVTATLPGNDSRVALEEVTEDGKNIIKAAWNESGETFTVMTTAEQQVTGEENDGGNVFTQTSGDQFTGTLPTAVSGQPYYAIYPPVDMYFVDEQHNYEGYNHWDEQGEIKSFSAEKVPFSLGLQDGILDEKLTLMYATSTDGEQFDFRHLTAIVKFTLTGLPSEDGPEGIKIAWQGGYKPKGTFNLTQSTTVAAMYPAAREGQECSVMVYPTITNGTATFYAYLPPIAQGKTLEISYYTRDENKIYDYTAQVQLTEKSIEAGKYYRVQREVTETEISTSMTAGNVQELQTWLERFQKFGGRINLTLTSDIDLTNPDLDGDPTNQSYWPVRLDLEDVIIDGGGHTLTGLKMNVTGEGESAAMFNYVSGSSVVKNLHLWGVDFSSSQYFAAGVVADNYGTVIGCSVSGSIKCKAGGYKAGGVVADNAGTVTACYSTGAVESEGIAGGVVGFNYRNVNYSVPYTGKVTACYSTSTVNGLSYSGVVVGHNQSPATVTTCYWSGTGATYGIGCDYSGNGVAIQVDGTTVTWNPTALNAMNAALPSDFGWEYKANTGADATAFPLVLQKTSGQ